MALDAALLEQIQTLVAPLTRDQREVVVQTIFAAPTPAASAEEEQRARMGAEQEAWFAQPASVREPYKGQYVAVWGGEVVDHDVDRMVLVLRVRDKWKGAPIPIVQAEQTEMRTFTIHSTFLDR